MSYNFIVRIIAIIYVFSIFTNIAHAENNQNEQCSWVTTFFATESHSYMFGARRTLDTNLPRYEFSYSSKSTGKNSQREITRWAVADTCDFSLVFFENEEAGTAFVKIENPNGCAFATTSSSDLPLFSWDIFTELQISNHSGLRDRLIDKLRTKACFSNDVIVKR